MPVTLALAGDTMLGRAVGERLAADPRHPLVAPDVAEVARAADMFVLNLECCISERGERVREPGKPFFFRAPPVAAERLAELGVDCVSLANNHALDYGLDALEDTLALLCAAGVAAVGAGGDEAGARAPVVLECEGLRLRLVAVSDHPSSFAARPDRPGIAFADLWQRELPRWLRDAVAPRDDADAVLVLPHWGPNMRPAPVAHVRWAAAELQAAGATLVAGHSAHVPQGPSGNVLFDLGDFVDDYAVDRALRNDLGLLWLVTLDAGGLQRIEAVPLRLELAFTRRASEVETTVLLALLEERCDAVGSAVARVGDRLVFSG
ncbi:MAG TPA: CapA family protein [Solirubrobacteraceae bacterium]|nr:CapA family protein [Solirubrobacteraceae bacterium]